MKSVFVFGLFEGSPGKTTFSCGLLHRLMEVGLDPVPLKARSGHNYWYQHNEFLPCINEGRIYCSDIIKLKEASGAEEPYEVLNPIDTLITPLNTGYYLNNETARSLYLADSDLFNHLAAERHTVIKNKKPLHTILIKKTRAHLLSSETLEKISMRADRILAIGNMNDWTRYYKQNANQAISTCTDSLKNHQVMVSEGFCDIIYPAPIIKHDVIVAVAPGNVVIYDPKRFDKAVRYHTVEGKNQFKASEIIPYLKPREIHSIPPLTKRELSDFERLSEAYVKPIESVISQL